MSLSEDDPKFRKLLEAWHGRDVYNFFVANDLSIQQVHGLPFAKNQRDLYVVLGLNQSHRDQYGLRTDSILALVLSHATQEAWFRTEVARLFVDANLRVRLAKTVALIFSPDRRIVAKCSAATAEELASTTISHRTAYVPINVEQLAKLTSERERQELMATALASHAFTVDHYNMRNPVPDDLFGRREIIQDVAADVRRLDHGIALLGLRRVGKTSILENVLSQLPEDADATWCVSFYDVESDGTDAANRVLPELFEALRKSARAAGVLSLPKASSGASLPDLVAFVLNASPLIRIVFAIDEVEHLVPDVLAPNADSIDAFNRAFGTLRSLKQRLGSRVAVIVCGINGTFVDTSHYGRTQNRVNNWFKAHHVQPLTADDSSDMLSTLGGRMGFALDNAFQRKVFDNFGGHPFLERQFCSVALAGSTRPRVVTIADFEAAESRFAPTQRTLFTEILTHLRFFYPDDYDALVEIVAGSAGVVELSPQAVEHLVSYGIVTARPEPLSVRMSALSGFLLKQAPLVARRRFNRLGRLGGGEEGDVYRAFDTELGRDCALKIYRVGIRRASADHECELMRIAVVIGAGEFVAAPYGVYQYGEQWCLAMEHVPGESLESVLSSAGRLPWKDCYSLAQNLFACMSRIHPASSEMDEFLSLSPREKALLNAEGECLYHRDLKPSNIVIERRDDWKLRLVDFGVASRADEASKTRVGTPLYLPPDWGIGAWDHTFDLYAIGRILWRCAFGNLPDVAQPTADLDGLGLTPAQRLAMNAFFGRALGRTSADRFRSAKEMAAAWEDAVTEFADFL